MGAEPGRAHGPTCLWGQMEGPRQVHVERASRGPMWPVWPRDTQWPNGRVEVSAGPGHERGPREVKGGFAHTRRPAWSLPRPLRRAPSQQPGHCLRPPPQPSAAVAAAYRARSGVQKASGLWCLTKNSCRSPLLGPGTSRCYLPAEAARWGPVCHAAPRARPLGSLGGAWALCSACTSLGSRGGGGRLISWALWSSLPGPVLLTPRAPSPCC